MERSLAPAGRNSSGKASGQEFLRCAQGATRGNASRPGPAPEDGVLPRDAVVIEPGRGEILLDEQ
eukprot:2884967-Alexandrium_andersonii.AAC.1